MRRIAKPNDLTGQRFGKLVVVRDSGERRNRFAVWECQCDCGNTALIVGAYLKNGRTRSCGCLRTGVLRNDLTGKRFGKLVVIRPTQEKRDNSVIWECLCDCGNTTFVRGSSLQKELTRSCGCLQREAHKVDLTGKRFGKLVALRATEERKNNYVIWECRCDCGKLVKVRSASLIKGTTRSCGCLRNEIRQNKQPDLTGQRFGKLLVLRDTGERRNYQIVWECQCDCGKKTSVVGYSLLRGATRSCGCIRRERTAKVNRTNLTGRRFGSLVAIRPLEERKNGIILWECRCDCGSLVTVYRNNLTSGNTKSCGCQSWEKLTAAEEGVMG